MFAIGVRTANIPRSLTLPVTGTPVLLDCNGLPLARLASAEARMQAPVRLDQMSPWLATATLALEDHRFQQHHGVDWHALLSASWRNLKAGHAVSGGSTLTQQLIKRASPPAARTLLVKWREFCAATAYEQTHSKDEILERYLNTVDYGNRLLGVEAASQNYFGQSARDLAPQQAVFLAGLVQAPSRFNPWTRPEQAADRYHRSVARLVELGIIKDEERSFWQTPPTVQPRQPWPGELQAPHFIAQIKARLKTAQTSSNRPVKTTLNLPLQQQVQALVSQRLQSLSPEGVEHASVVVLDHRTGAVRAWVGSGGWMYPDGQMDGVVTPRSAGSTLKPFLYLDALDLRLITASTLLPDTPDAVRNLFPDYDPRNFDERFWGPVRVREALANSLNVPAVVTLARVGPRRAAHFMEECGVKLARGFDTYGAGLILGNAEVRLLDLAAAYGLFANGGRIAAPRLLESDPLRHSRVAHPESVAILADILSDDEARRKSFGPFSSLAFEGHSIPAKTGTSSGFRDAWTLGMTGHHVVGVWMGNFSGKAMKQVASVTGPAPLWHEIIELLIKSDPDMADDLAGMKVERHPVCRLTGLRPCPLSLAVRQEWFLPGTAPQSDASAHFVAGTAESPAQVLLPEAYAVWCQSSHNYLGALATATTLSIAQPRNGAVFEIDPHLPAARQQMELIAIGVDVKAALKWRVDGETLTAPNGNPTLWPIVAGNHLVEVSDGTRWASASFAVK